MITDHAYSVLVDQFNNSLVPQVTQFILFIAPIMLAFFLAGIFWRLWVDYVRSYANLKKKYAVLEIKLPKETWKSPLAMETVLNALRNTADGSTFAQFWKGETRPWYSLEIISVEGTVKFMIWTEDVRKKGVASALYAQFPDLEIREIEDYTKSVYFDPKTIRIHTIEFTSSQDDVYPIKTYVDYKLDKDPKEEFKVDPLLPFLEFMGSMGPNQQVWLQILIRAHKDDQNKKGTLFGKTDSWKEKAKKTINEILIRDEKTKVSGEINSETGYSRMPTLTEIEKESVTAIERKMAKPLFDVGIRTLYISPISTFDTPTGIGGRISSMNQFNHEHLNGFKPDKKWHQLLGDPWQDFMNIRRNRYGRMSLLAYKMRSFFYTPFARKSIVLNSEELATMYHFPGSVAKTPTLERIPSKRAQAPENLPV